MKPKFSKMKLSELKSRLFRVQSFICNKESPDLSQNLSLKKIAKLISQGFYLPNVNLGELHLTKEDGKLLAESIKNNKNVVSINLCNFYTRYYEKIRIN